jgi:hypothetical protein
MKSCQKYFSTCLLATAALLGGASTAFAAAAPPLGTAGDFAVLSVGTASVNPLPSPDATAAVTFTGSGITGNVGSNGAATLTDSTITGNLELTGAETINAPSTVGAVVKPLRGQVVTDFNAAYTALNETCTAANTINTAAFTGVPLSVGSGVTCFPAAVTFTNSVLTLTGNGPWILRVGAALEGTSMTVVMANGGNACNVFWQVAAAAKLTTSVFQGNILAGAAITTTGGVFAGRALAKAGVTMTNTIVTGCSALPGAPPVPACKPGKRLVCESIKDRDDDDENDCKQRGSAWTFPWKNCVKKDDWRDDDKRGDNKEGRRD